MNYSDVVRKGLSVQPPSVPQFEPVSWAPVNDWRLEDPLPEDSVVSYEVDSVRYPRGAMGRRPRKVPYIQRNPEDVARTLVRTKVCRNVTEHGSCSRENCSFAHNADELVLPNCMFDNSCRYLDGSDRVCQFKHSCESIDEYYTRTGLSLPSFSMIDRPNTLPRLRKTKVFLRSD